MIEVGDVGRFQRVEPGRGFKLEGDRRRVTLEVNCETITGWHLLSSDGEMRFLAAVSGRDTITFITEGSVGLMPTSDGEVWVWCSEFDTQAVFSDQPSFTTIATRQGRNPELERMMALMNENMERRMAYVAAQFDEVTREAEARAAAAEAKEAERERKRAERAAKRKATTAGAVGGEPVVAADAGGAVEAASGEDGGDDDAES